MTPPIRVDAVRVVHDDGLHNAFTDLCSFGGRYYLTFRSCPDGHMIHPTSRIVVLSSSDAVRWERVHSFAVPGRDVRDPHFLTLGERLFVISGAVRVGPEAPAAYDIDQHQGFSAWTADGRTWHGPRAMEGTSGYYVWRAVSRDGVAYLCGRRKRRTAPENEADELRLLQATLLASRDGFSWTEVGVVQAEYGGETAFLFEPDGSLLAIVRNRAAALPARVCRAGAPYRAWTGRELDRNIGGPLLARWGRNHAGRRQEDHRAEPRRDDAVLAGRRSGCTTRPSFPAPGTTRTPDSWSSVPPAPCCPTTRALSTPTPAHPARATGLRCAARRRSIWPSSACASKRRTAPRCASGRRLGTAVECAVRVSGRYL